MPFFNPEIERMDREDLDALIDERVRYTIAYAAEHSPFYHRWFQKHSINPAEIREHEDLLHLPVISGKVIRENQPPETEDFGFLSVRPEEVFTIHETSGTSGVPKAFFLTWEDWERYAEKYARAFVAQGFGPGDRVVVCASYGMNVGANTMTWAARNIGFSIIPEGKCNFPVRIIRSYRPTGIVGSVFKLLRLARRLKGEGASPEETGIERLVVGGESFAEESRAYLDEVWGLESCNIYGSTEGTMCGECQLRTGLHVPEDLVHMDLYDPALQEFVPDGECGRIVLSTLLPVGGKAGFILINYDTDDTSVVLTRERCECGRSHMKILNPQREAETIWIADSPVNRVDIERGVFQRENMEYLTGEYEAFVYGGEEEGETTLRVSVECEDTEECGRKTVEESFLSSFFRYKKGLEEEYLEGNLQILFRFTGPGGLELHQVKGRPKRLVDRR
ncbi:MAG: coenzyme F390 synthetase [Methanomicrobiaceae archaeon]|nr:coenzyme F390 synthetase [Methanomicrobiaceae archaeon]